MTDNSSRAAIPRGDWENFTRFQLNIYAQLLYNQMTWHAGFRIGVPFTVLSRNLGPTSPLRLEFFYRLPLLARQIRSASSGSSNENSP